MSDEFIKEYLRKSVQARLGINTKSKFSKPVIVRKQQDEHSMICTDIAGGGSDGKEGRKENRNMMLFSKL